LARTLEVGDDSSTGFHQLVRLDAEDVVPRAGGGPDLVVLLQIGVDEHPQVGLVTEGRHATDGFWIPQRLNTSMNASASTPA
jgi:hypothetical protein